ncbi:hypothetical protein ACTHGU_12955 [Chitinophagaceae bacterium MMS25-I14]
MSAPETKTAGSSDKTGITKWLVIGSVIIIALLIFKNPIERLLDRASDVNVDITKGTIAIKTVQTAIGEVKVTSEKVDERKATEIATANTGMKNQVAEDYMLAWPPESWEQRSDLIPAIQNFYQQQGTNATVSFVCRQKIPDAADFYSNVYVVSMPYNESYSFEAQVQLTIQMLRTSMNATFTTTEIDAESRGATLGFTYDYNGQRLFQVQRFGYKNGQLISVVATTSPDDKPAQGQIRDIVNSFRIVS